MKESLPIKQWECPCCKSAMKVAGYFEADCPSGGSFNKEEVVCANDHCPTIKLGVFWDRYGDLYGDFSGYEHKDFLYIGNNNSPFGSLGRKSNVEISGADIDRGRWIYFWLTDKYALKIEYKYTSDYAGNILGRKIK